METMCKVCSCIEEHSLRPNGRPAHRCKKCQRAYGKEHYQANKSKHNVRRYANKKATRQKMRDIISEKKDVPCADCGRRFPKVCMDFDHQRDKLFNVSHLAVAGSIKRLLEEIEKCEVVCANCHRVRTQANRAR